jgi:hypothetical protein
MLLGDVPPLADPFEHLYRYPDARLEGETFLERPTATFSRACVAAFGRGEFRLEYEIITARAM